MLLSRRRTLALLLTALLHFCFCHRRCCGSASSAVSIATAPHWWQPRHHQLHHAADQSGSSPPMHAKMPGDLIIGALYPMHYGNLLANSTAHRCAAVNPYEGVQAFEATLFTLDRLRQQRLLGNATLGVLAMDTCQDVDFALSQSLNFTNVLISGFIGQGMIRCSDGSEPGISGSLTELMKIVGVLGAAESDVSVAIASFMKHFRIPQISHMSTSPVLSNKEKFPFFLRTVPSDANTVQGIVHLLRSRNWTYVHVVYDDTNYGTMAFNAFEELISNRTDSKESKICISTKMKIDSLKWEPKNYEQGIHDTLLAPSNANIVLVFLSQPTLAAFLDALAQYRVRCSDQPADDECHRWTRRIGQLAWIGTDSWSGWRFRPSEHGLLNRSVIIMPRTGSIPGFADYITGLKPSTHPVNPWLREWFEEECDCRYGNVSFGDMGGRRNDCLPIEEECRKLVFKDFVELPTLHFVSDAIYAYAYAIKSIQSSLAPRNITPDSVRGDTLMSHLRNITFTKCTGEPFMFYNGIDGPPEYSIQYYSFRDARWRTGGTYIGTKPLNERLTANQSLESVFSRYPESRCSDDCAPDEAKQFPTSSCCWLCVKCGRYDIVTQDETLATLWLRRSAASQACSVCPNGTQPDDARRHCRPLPLSWSGYSHSHTIPVTLISGLGLVAALVFAAVFFVKRDTPLIKASGRETSAVLLVGIFLSYFFPYMMMLKPHLAVCMLIRVAPGLCFTVCHAAILAKTNRIARIFQVSSSTSKKTKFTSPISQLYIIGSMVIAELLILSVGLIVDTPQPTIRESHEQRVLECSGVNAAHLSASISFPIVLLVLATMYAFKIRKVPDGFNETRMVAFVNYANCAVIIILIPVMFVLDKEVQTGVVLCYGMQLSATAVLLGLFLPKVYIVLARPEKNTKEAVMSRTRSLGTINSKYAQIEMRNSMGSVPQDMNNLEPCGSSAELHYSSSRHASVAKFHTDSINSSDQQQQQQQQQQQLSRTDSGAAVPCTCMCRVHKNVSFSDVEILRQPAPDNNRSGPSTVEEADLSLSAKLPVSLRVADHQHPRKQLQQQQQPPQQTFRQLSVPAEFSTTV